MLRCTALQLDPGGFSLSRLRHPRSDSAGELSVPARRFLIRVKSADFFSLSLLARNFGSFTVHRTASVVIRLLSVPSRWRRPWTMWVLCCPTRFELTLCPGQGVCSYHSRCCVSCLPGPFSHRFCALGLYSLHLPVSQALAACLLCCRPATSFWVTDPVVPGSPFTSAEVEARCLLGLLARSQDLPC